MHGRWLSDLKNAHPHFIEKKCAPQFSENVRLFKQHIVVIVQVLLLHGSYNTFFYKRCANFLQKGRAFSYNAFFYTRGCIFCFYKEGAHFFHKRGTHFFYKTMRIFYKKVLVFFTKGARIFFTKGVRIFLQKGYAFFHKRERIFYKKGTFFFYKRGAHCMLKYVDVLVNYV